ncbi:hypothetical protein BE17_10800 [Sorangium cellulosum]|uniref:Uncharacterized protein n=1 Tax=Sorangium cellulosum TaxID=56 RepID=A0A150R9C9_SORCE|nr:hypothetical protein BE17_10800 [Sorangium cellulosum]
MPGDPPEVIGVLAPEGRTRRRPQTNLAWPVMLQATRTRYSAPGVTAIEAVATSVALLDGVIGVA